MASTGMYISPERVERGGFLVAYAGEVMSKEEAVKRGLLAEADKKPARTRKPAQKRAGSGKAK